MTVPNRRPNRKFYFRPNLSYIPWITWSYGKDDPDLDPFDLNFQNLRKIKTQPVNLSLVQIHVLLYVFFSH